MQVRLVVVRPFGSYRKGSVIEDPAEVGKILGSVNASEVVKVAGSASNVTNTSEKPNRNSSGEN